MHTSSRWLRGLGVLGIWAALVLPAVAAKQDDQEQSLLQTLRTGEPADKAMACKQLAIHGSAAAVPELAKLLTDPQLASWSRIAIEAIPGPASDEALREASTKVSGRLLVGTLNSIGVRRDAGAVELLVERLKDQDADVASAAAVALGWIANPKATAALSEALADSRPAVRSAVAEGCILCAERLTGCCCEEASKLYDQVRKANLPKQRVVEATRGAILARKVEGIPLLVEQLKSDDKVFFQLGLQTARELQGPEVAKAIVAEIVGASPERASLFLVVLADRHDTAVLPAVLEAATSGPQEVRMAAIGVLPRLGDESCVAPLMQLATGSDPELAAAAKAALAGLPGKSVDADITTRLANAQESSLPVLLELVGLRRIDAKGDLLKAANSSQPNVRAAALTALGATVGPQDLNVLISEVISPKHPEDAQVAQTALKAACIRMPEGDACADQLTAAMANAPAATKGTLLEIIGAMGTARSLEALAAAAKSGDSQLADVATKALGEWMNLEAAPVLLDLAKNLTEEKYQVRALKGYMRLARQFVKPNQDGQRVNMCKQAFDAAKRPAEQKLVIETLLRAQTLEALRLAVRAAQKPELRADATRVANTIAQKLGPDKPEVKQLLAKLEPVAAN